MRRFGATALILLSGLGLACGDDPGASDTAGDTGTGGTGGSNPTTSPTTSPADTGGSTGGGADESTGGAATSTGATSATGGTAADSSGGSSTGEQLQDVTIQFAARVGDQNAVCNQTYDGLGLMGTTIELRDLRFYVHDLFLVDGDGNETEVMLEQDGQWQYENVALLDFEDGTGACDTGTNADLNTTVRGTITPGDYVGIHFTVGVPFDLNHLDIDAATTEPPLNLQAMFWVWAAGHKFMRIDIFNDLTPPDNAWDFHLGAQGCMSMSPMDPPTEACTRPALVNVLLPTGFDPDTGTVVLDLAQLYNGVDVTADTPMSTPGCHSFMPDANECDDLFPNLGLDWTTGACANDCADQTVFSVE